MPWPHLRRRWPTPRWLLLLTVCASAFLHGGLAWLADRVFTLPDLDVRFAVPVDLEIGLTEELAIDPSRQEGPATAAQSSAGPDPGEEQAQEPAPKPAEKPAESKHAARSEPAREPARAPEAGTEDGLDRLPAGTQIALRVDMDKVRRSPLAADIRRVLSTIPDWQALLEGSGIDPIEALDKLLIATPDLRREKVVIAGRYQGGRQVVDAAVRQLAERAGAPAAFAPRFGVPVAPWRSPDPTPRVIALIGPSHFVIAREQDLPKMLAIARARARPGRERPEAGAAVPADALLSMEEGAGLSLEVEGVARFVQGRRLGIPTRLRLSAVEEPGASGLAIRARLSYPDAAAADQARDFWGRTRDAYAQSPLIGLLGLARPLEDAWLETRDTELLARTQLTAGQARLILGYLQELVTPAPARGP